MNNILKTVALLLYLLAAFSAVVTLPAGFTKPLYYVVVILLAAHALEVLVAFKHIRRYLGPLVDSIALTLLFGFMHWAPLKRSSTA